MPRVPNSERENNILSLYHNFPCNTSITCLFYKECQLTISGIVNCSLWFVDIYDPNRIFLKISCKITASTVLYVKCAQ